jgi:hypothetical protein
VDGKRDLVHVHVTADLPIRAQALPFADRIEVRFGSAFPVALIVDGPAVRAFESAVTTSREQLEAAKVRHGRQEISP